MFTIYAKLVGHDLTLVAQPPLASGSVQFDRVHFEFDETWDGLSKVALFWGDASDDPYASIVNGDGFATVPYEVLQEKSKIRFGVYGTAAGQTIPRMTSTLIKYQVPNGAWSDSIQNSGEPTPTLIEQFTAAAEAAIAEAQEVAEDCVSFATAQTLTDAQQEQARANIDAPATGDIDALRALVQTLCPAVTIGPAAVASVSDSVALAPDSLIVAVTLVQSGEGDPSPTNIRPITGWTGANVYHAGKNLLGGFASGTGTGNGLTFTYNGGTHITISGVQTGSNADSPSKQLMDEALSNPRSLFVPAGTTLTIELKNTGLVSTPGILILFNTEENITLNSAETTNLKWTITPSVDVHLTRMRFRGKTVNADYGTISGDIMLYFGGGDTEYTAPVTQTAIAVSWQTEAGTVYGGTLDVLTGTLTVDRVKVTLTGAEDNAAISWGAYSIRVPDIIVNSNSGVQLTHCSHTNDLISGSAMSTSQDSGHDIAACVSAGPRVRFRNRSLADTTLEGYKAYLAAELEAGHPVEVIAKCAQDGIATYQLTPAQITMLTGANTIWADCGNTTLTYRANPYDRLLALIRSYHPETMVQSVSPLMMSAPDVTDDPTEGDDA